MWDKLVEEAKKGNQESMGEIVNRLQPLIISSIRKYYNNFKEYEDLVQEGNLMILESINKFDPTKGVHFLGYIKLNLRFLYLDKHKRKLHLSLNEPIGEDNMEMIDFLVSDEMDALDVMLENETNTQLSKALEKLTERQREIIVLYYVNKMGMEDIANKLGISYRTVVNTKTKALEKLRKQM